MERVLFQNIHWSKTASFEVPIVERDILKKLLETLLTSKLILFLTGPRRVGKSILLKQVINSLIKRSNIEPRQILFYEFSRGESKEKIWDVYKFFNTEISDPNQLQYLFFDEIQYINGYEIILKEIYDNRSNVRIIATGSLSLFYKKKMEESLAGRFISFRLFPLSFREFLKISKSELLDSFDLARTEKNTYIKSLKVDTLNTVFREFLVWGRYPEMITLSSDLKKSYLSSILTQSLNQDAFTYFNIEKPDLLNELYEHICINNGGLINYKNLSSTASSKTIASYLKVLEIMGIAYFVYNTLKPFAKGNSLRKGYVNSSFYLDKSKHDMQTAYGFAVESYILERLLEQGNLVTFYHRRNEEVDFVLPKEKLAYEVKFRSNIEKPKQLLKNFEIRLVTLNNETPACLF